MTAADVHPQDRDLEAAELRIAVVVARYHEDVTRRLLRGALEALERHQAAEPDVFWVPGALELPVTALALAERAPTTRSSVSPPSSVTRPPISKSRRCRWFQG